MHTNTILDSTVTPVTGTLTGEWFAFQGDSRTHNLVSLAVLGGTGTVALQGRIDPSSPITQVTSVTATDTQLVARFPQYRVVITGATALQARVTVDRAGVTAI